MPVEILGSVYERFLGSLLQLKGKSAKVEEKPEVRKAGGVFYTPRHVVKFIIEQTLGKVLDQIEVNTKDYDLKTFQDVTNEIKILDPACGSGTFLIQAYERVCEHWQRRMEIELKKAVLS